jgi:hypothetical protein
MGKSAGNCKKMFFRRNELGDLLEAKGLASLSAKNELVFECKKRKTNSRKQPEMQQKYEKIPNSRRPQSRSSAVPPVVVITACRHPRKRGFSPVLNGLDSRRLTGMTGAG